MRLLKPLLFVPVVFRRLIGEQASSASISNLGPVLGYHCLPAPPPITKADHGGLLPLFVYWDAQGISPGIRLAERIPSLTLISGFGFGAVD